MFDKCAVIPQNGQSNVKSGRALRSPRAKSRPSSHNLNNNNTLHNMKKVTLSSLFAVAALAATSALAQNAKFTASRTFEFDPDKSGTAVAYWDRTAGEADASTNTRFGLRLEKNAPINANVSVGC